MTVQLLLYVNPVQLKVEGLGYENINLKKIFGYCYIIGANAYMWLRLIGTGPIAPGSWCD